MALIGIEVRMLLDKETAFETEGGLSLLSDCYVMMEYAISFLSTGDNDDNDDSNATSKTSK